MTEEKKTHDGLEAFIYLIIRDCGFGVVNLHIRDVIKADIAGKVADGKVSIFGDLPGPTHNLTCPHGAAQAVEVAKALRRLVLPDFKWETINDPRANLPRMVKP